MARKPKKQQPQPEQANSSFDEFSDDADGIDEDVANADVGPGNAPQGKSRDWRDVEKLKEERLLRSLVDDDLDMLDDLDGSSRRRR